MEWRPIAICTVCDGDLDFGRELPDVSGSAKAKLGRSLERNARRETRANTAETNAREQMTRTPSGAYSGRMVGLIR